MIDLWAKNEKLARTAVAGRAVLVPACLTQELAHSAQRTAHSAQRTAHSAQRTAHSAQRTAQYLNTVEKLPIAAADFFSYSQNYNSRIYKAGTASLCSRPAFSVYAHDSYSAFNSGAFFCSASMNLNLHITRHTAFSTHTNTHTLGTGACAAVNVFYFTDSHIINHNSCTSTHHHFIALRAGAHARVFKKGNSGENGEKNAVAGQWANAGTNGENGKKQQAK